MRGTATPTLDRLGRLHAELDGYRTRATTLRQAYDAQCTLVGNLYRDPPGKPSWRTAAAAAQRLWVDLQAALDEILRLWLLITGIKHAGQLRLHKCLAVPQKRSYPMGQWVCAPPGPVLITEAGISRFLSWL
jgi:hypothetical protein